MARQTSAMNCIYLTRNNLHTMCQQIIKQNGISANRKISTLGYHDDGCLTMKMIHISYFAISFPNGFHLIWQIVHTTPLYVIIALILLLYTQVFLRVQFLALCFSPCILRHCLPLLTHTLSYIIHLLMTYNYRCLLPQIEYLSYFTLCSHV